MPHFCQLSVSFSPPSLPSTPSFSVPAYTFVHHSTPFNLTLLSATARHAFLSTTHCRTSPRCLVPSPKGTTTPTQPTRSPERDDGRPRRRPVQDAGLVRRGTVTLGRRYYGDWACILRRTRSEGLAKDGSYALFAFGENEVEPSWIRFTRETKEQETDHYRCQVSIFPRSVRQFASRD